MQVPSRNGFLRRRSRFYKFRACLGTPSTACHASSLRSCRPSRPRNEHPPGTRWSQRDTLGNLLKLTFAFSRQPIPQSRLGNKPNEFLEILILESHWKISFERAP